MCRRTEGTSTTAQRHGRISWRMQGTSPPEFGVGDANANCLLRLCHIGTKRSILWLQNTPKSVFSRGSALDPAPPDSLFGWGENTPRRTSTHSAPTHLRRLPCIPPESQSDLRLCPALVWRFLWFRRRIQNCRLTYLHTCMMHGLLLSASSWADKTRSVQVCKTWTLTSPDGIASTMGHWDTCLPRLPTVPFLVHFGENVTANYPNTE